MNNIQFWTDKEIGEKQISHEYLIVVVQFTKEIWIPLPFLDIGKEKDKDLYHLSYSKHLAKFLSFCNSYIGCKYSGTIRNRYNNTDAKC